MGIIRVRPTISATFALLAVLAGAGPSLVMAATADAAERLAMMEIIEAHMQRTEAVDGALAPSVREAMLAVPRHEFVPFESRRWAYADRPLPIEHGQTISQPFIVALMTHLLNVESGDRVLEIGTGSGYQAAVLAALGVETYSIEIVPPLGETAKVRLGALDYAVTTRIGDGYYGWEAAAPFDGIVVTAAASQIPPPLIDQLALGGVMVIPVGAPFTVQRLMLVRRDGDGLVSSQMIIPVRFVPLTGGH